MSSNRSELVIIYGRRRVGKTFLVEQHFNQDFDFWYLGRRNIPTKEQLRQFGRALTKYSGERYKLTTWYEAFDALEDYLETLPQDKKKVVFFDEMPWIDRVHSNFVSAFEGFWNGWAMSRGDIIKSKEDEVLNYFVDRSTNASAESLNSKLKLFRAQLHGVSDLPFFLYRVSVIFG